MKVKFLMIALALAVIVASGMIFMKWTNGNMSLLPSLANPSKR